MLRILVRSYDIVDQRTKPIAALSILYNDWCWEWYLTMANRSYSAGQGYDKQFTLRMHNYASNGLSRYSNYTVFSPKLSPIEYSRQRELFVESVSFHPNKYTTSSITTCWRTIARVQTLLYIGLEQKAFLCLPSTFEKQRSCLVCVLWIAKQLNDKRCARSTAHTNPIFFGL